MSYDALVVMSMIEEVYVYTVYMLRAHIMVMLSFCLSETLCTIPDWLLKIGSEVHRLLG